MGEPGNDTPDRHLPMIVRTLPLGHMSNLVYLIEDSASRRVAVVDPAWDVGAILDHADDSHITDILVSHWHDDHVNAVDELASRTGARIHLLETEAQYWRVSRSTLVLHNDGDRIALGTSTIGVLQTPGHSPGSACFHVGEALFTGDTLFMYGCGRCDLSGGDPQALYHSLQRLVDTFAPATTVYPGHDYADIAQSSLKEQIDHNPFLHQTCVDSFVAFRNEHNNHRHPPYRPVVRGDPAW